MRIQDFSDAPGEKGQYCALGIASSEQGVLLCWVLSGLYTWYGLLLKGQWHQGIFPLVKGTL